MRKSLYLTCNAWLYNGTDLLWASLLEEMWLKVEEEFGTWSVRFHRFTIDISGESKTDDILVKKGKRDIAVLKFVLKLVLSFILAIVFTVSAVIYNETIEVHKSSPRSLPRCCLHHQQLWKPRPPLHCLEKGSPRRRTSPPPSIPRWGP